MLSLSMNWVSWTLLAILFLVVLWSVGIWWYAKSIETPPYTVIQKYDHFEIREYEPILVAQTEEEKSGQKGLNSGFMILANYIFGNNSTQSPIAMTTPVIDKEQSQPIAMTTPVIDSEQNGKKIITFTLPKKWNMETIPKPNNPKVTLKEWPQEKKAASSFFLFRFNNEPARETAKNTLLEELEKNGISHKNDVSFAFYNPPWTPFFLRRNEVMITLEQ